MSDNMRDMLNFDDLLFEKRNKDYGAYQLRKRYKSVLGFSIIFASILLSSLIIIPFMIKPAPGKVFEGGRGFVQVEMQNLEPPSEDFAIPPPPPPPRAVTKMQESVKYIAPVVVDTISPVEMEQLTTDQYLSLPSDDQTDTEGTSTGTGTGDESYPGMDGIGTDEPFFLVEVMPAFRGGDLNKFREWVQRRTNYPQEAIEKKIRGTVFLTFIVEPDGAVSNVNVVKGVDPLIDNEAIKSIQASPKWSPGLQRGQPVRVRYLMPLSFVF
jgi:periplasmic protein TonB